MELVIPIPIYALDFAGYLSDPQQEQKNNEPALDEESIIKEDQK